MRLTVFTDYTLRSLTFLALRPDRLVTIADIAKSYQISNNHLMKVVHQLAISGDVATVRGQRGGLRLARPPEQINLGTVVRRTEADMHMVPCSEAGTVCVISPDCMLAGVVAEALRAFLGVLDGYTLADLVRPRLGLAQLLRIEERVPEPELV